MSNTKPSGYYNIDYYGKVISELSRRISDISDQITISINTFGINNDATVGGDLTVTGSGTFSDTLYVGKINQLSTGTTLYIGDSSTLESIYIGTGDSVNSIQIGNSFGTLPTISIGSIDYTTIGNDITSGTNSLAFNGGNILTIGDTNNIDTIRIGSTGNDSKNVHIGNSGGITYIGGDLYVTGTITGNATTYDTNEKKIILNDYNTVGNVVASTISSQNITIASPPTTLDGVSLVDGYRILVKNQTTSGENGVYVYYSSGLIRASDSATVDDLPSGTIVYISSGTIHGDSNWSVSTAPTTIDTDVFDQLIFTEVSSLIDTIRGSGISCKAGDDLSQAYILFGKDDVPTSGNSIRFKTAVSDGEATLTIGDDDINILTDIGDQTITGDTTFDGDVTVTGSVNGVDLTELKSDFDIFVSNVVTLTGSDQTMTGNLIILDNLVVDNLLIDGNSINVKSTSTSGNLDLGSNLYTTTVNLGTGDNISAINIGTSTGGVINIGTGTSGTNIINIGGTGDTVNITGSVFYTNVTELTTRNGKIYLNYGNVYGTGYGCGIVVQEDVDRAWILTTVTRDGWRFRVPQFTTDIYLKPDTWGGYIITSEGKQTINGYLLIGNKLGINMATDPSLELEVNGTAKSKYFTYLSGSSYVDLATKVGTNNTITGLDTLISTLQTGKQDTISGPSAIINTTYSVNLLTNTLTSNKVLTSSAYGTISASSISSTELGYLSGLSANIASEITRVDGKTWTTYTYDSGKVYGRNNKVGIKFDVTAKEPGTSLHVAGSSGLTSTTTYSSNSVMILENNNNGGLQLMNPKGKSGCIYFGHSTAEPEWGKIGYQFGTLTTDPDYFFVNVGGSTSGTALVINKDKKMIVGGSYSSYDDDFIGIINMSETISSNVYQNGINISITNDTADEDRYIDGIRCTITDTGDWSDLTTRKLSCFSANITATSEYKADIIAYYASAVNAQDTSKSYAFYAEPNSGWCRFNQVGINCGITEGYYLNVEGKVLIKDDLLIENGSVSIEESLSVTENMAITGTSTMTGVVTIGNTTQSTGSLDGALIVKGGEYISKKLYVVGEAYMTAVTGSTSYTSGALVVTGGVGIGENLYIYGNTNMTGSLTNTSTTNSTSYSSGAIIISGGVGIAQDVYTNGSLSIGGNLDINSHYIQNVLSPINDDDVATKSYVDNLSSGINPLNDVTLATTTNITILSLPTSIDGTTLSSLDAGTRILVKDQTTTGENGVYTYTSGVLTRASDMNAVSEAEKGTYIYVLTGTENAETSWIVSTAPTTYTSGNFDQLSFTKYIITGTLTAGDGLQKSGNTFSVGGTSNRMTINTDTIDIASTYVGQTSLTTLGTITTGTWNGTAISLTYGGTGASSASSARTNLGLGTISTQSSDSIAITGGSITGLTSLTIANDIDVGDYAIRAKTFTSDVAIGTAPFTITSTTKVDNLNVHYLNSKEETAFILVNGTRELTSDWDVGNYNITARRLISDITTGSAPFSVNSTTKVSNLNVEYLDGVKAVEFLKRDGTQELTANWSAGSTKQITVGTIAVTGTTPFVVTNSTLVSNLNADKVDGKDETAFVLVDGSRELTSDWDIGDYTLTAKSLILDIATGTTPMTISSTTVVANLNADKIDGYDATDLILANGTNELTADWDAGDHEITAYKFISTITGSTTAPFVVSSTKIVDNLNVQYLNGKEAPDGTIVGTSDSQILTNKTLTLPQINDTSSDHQYVFAVSELSTDRTVTLPLLTSDDSFVFESHIQTLSNKILTLPQINDTSSDHQYIFAVSELIADRTITLPLLTSNDTFVFESYTQTLSNKTLTLPQINDTSSDHQYIFAVSELSADRTITLPLLTSNDAFVFENHTQTLTNKTLTNPTITTGSIDGSSIGATTAITTLTVDNLNLDGNTIISTNSNGGIYISPNGTGEVSIGSNLTINNNRITSVASPINSTDVANKAYADAISAGLIPKLSVKVKTNEALDSYTKTGTGVGAYLEADVNGTLPDIDEVSLEVDQRLLVDSYGSSSDIDNGIYTVTSLGGISSKWKLTRATDADTDGEVDPGMYCYIELGSTYGGTGWVLISGTVVDTDELIFTQFNATESITAGAGLVKDGIVLDIGSGNGITINADSVEIALDGVSNSTSGLKLSSSGIAISSNIGGTGLTLSSGILNVDASQTQITALGTLVTGTWNATEIGVAYGGTGTTTLTSGYFLQGNGTSAVTTTKIVPSGVVVGTTDEQTLTNKTLTSAVLITPYIQDGSGSYNYGITGSTLASDITLTLPTLTSGDTFLFASSSQSLTNKTGNISMWTNDTGYIKKDGTVTLTTDWDTGTNMSIKSGIKEKVYRTEITTTSYQITTSDYSTIVTKASQTYGFDISVRLPKVADVPYRKYMVVDEKGVGATRNIYVRPHEDDTSVTISGASLYSITTNYGAVTLYNNGSNWFITSKVV
jgi:hypothetical protein